MDTKILTITEDARERALIIQAAAAILRGGGLVVFPTETVYGLGAICSHEAALLKIFTVKGRPGDNPLIAHIWNLAQLPELARTISPRAQLLIEKFWPGPLTLIFPKQKEVSPLITAGLDTVAVRMPSHPVARELLQAVDIPVAAPSANLSGKPSPSRGLHAIHDLAGKVEAVIDAGPCAAGIESTVLTLADDAGRESRPVILRPGSITRETLEAVLGEKVEVSGVAPLGQTGGAQTAEDVAQPRSPGMKYRHYAPQAPVWLIEGENRNVVAEINRLLESLAPGMKAAVLGTTENIGAYHHGLVLDLGSQKEPATIAARLYDLLRLCDQLPIDRIFIEGVAPQGVGLAISNRLHKAAGGNVIYV
ncbi:MAG: threonylcarbamoyl-AMP synthase [Firmicutes bacterium]|nr:threonylcarbamoyl-AMP synthase [Bacillota bacterium]